MSVAPDEADPRYAGHSTAKWEGATLVVTTVGIKETVRFRNVPHSAGMRITERLRLGIRVGKRLGCRRRQRGDGEHQDGRAGGQADALAAANGRMTVHKGARRRLDRSQG